MFFATMFPNQALAEAAQRAVEAFSDEGAINLAASVVITKDADGRISTHNGKTPGALGAVMTGLIGGVIGLIGGPPAALLGAAAGGLSGGWFDLMRVEERTAFMNDVARRLGEFGAVLLAEVIDPTISSRQLVEAELVRMGGTRIV
jgi:uncharacterized membrane protein